MHLSPILLNLYSEMLIKEAVDEEHRIKINGKKISTIRYADDTAVMAPTQDHSTTNDGQKFSLACKNYGMKLNVKKTKVMILKKGNEKENTKIKVDGEYLEQVSHYKYLGSKIDENCSSLAEVRVRIGMARAVFWDCKEFLRRDMLIDLKIRLLDCYIKSVVSYGCETWTFNKEIIQRLDALQL